MERKQDMLNGDKGRIKTTHKIVKDLFTTISSLKKFYDRYAGEDGKEIQKVAKVAKEITGDRRKPIQVDLEKILSLKKEVNVLDENLKKVKEILATIKENAARPMTVKKSIGQLAIYLKEGNPSTKTAKMLADYIGKKCVIAHIKVFHNLEEPVLYDLFQYIKVHETSTRFIDRLDKSISSFDGLSENTAIQCLQEKRKDLILNHIKHFAVLGDSVVNRLINEGDMEFIIKHPEHFSRESEHSKHNSLLINMKTTKNNKQEKLAKKDPPKQNKFQQKIEDMIKHNLGQGVVDTLLNKKGVDKNLIAQMLWKQDRETFKANINKFSSLSQDTAKLMLADEKDFVLQHIDIFKEEERDDIVGKSDKINEKNKKEKKENTPYRLAQKHLLSEEYSEITFEGMTSEEASALLNKLMGKKQFLLVQRAIPTLENIDISVAENLIKNLRISTVAENIVHFKKFSEEFANQVNGIHYDIDRGRKEDYSRVVDEYPDRFADTKNTNVERKIQEKTK